MKNFTIENETSNITIHGSVKEAEAVPNSKRFSNEAALAKLAANWLAARLGRDLEQPAGRNGGKEVPDPRHRRIADLESDPEPRPDCPGCRRTRAGC
jgi:hypothetical protein